MAAPELPVRKKLTIFDDNKFVKVKQLGSGQFGTVHKARILHQGSLNSFVAIKELKGKPTIGSTRIGKPNSGKVFEVKLFESELKIMHYVTFKSGKPIGSSEFNIVSLMGTNADFTSIIMNYCNEGDAENLKQYLITTLNHVPLREVLRFGVQMLTACEYLTEIRVAHNDWACRNILVNRPGLEGEFVYKLSDFGLSTYCKNNSDQNNAEDLDSIHKSFLTFDDLLNSGRKLPLRQLAPEIHFNLKYLDKSLDETSNTWSCCLAIIEFATIAEKPTEPGLRPKSVLLWPEIKNLDELASKLRNFHKDPEFNPLDYQPKPVFMTLEVFDLIKTGLNQIYLRPSCESIRKKLAKIPSGY